MKEQARRVVQILIDHQCEAGIDIANGMAQVWFTKAGLDDHEYRHSKLPPRTDGSSPPVARRRRRTEARFRHGARSAPGHRHLDWNELQV